MPDVDASLLHKRRQFLFCIQTGRPLKLRKTKTPLQMNFGYPASFSVHIWCEFRRLTVSHLFLHIRRLSMTRTWQEMGR